MHGGVVWRTSITQRSWRPQFVRSLASPCSYQKPPADIQPYGGMHDVLADDACDRTTVSG